MQQLALLTTQAYKSGPKKSPLNAGFFREVGVYSE